MMDIDRDLWLEILKTLDERPRMTMHMRSLADGNGKKLHDNLNYLTEHGLIGWDKTRAQAHITAKGHDYLQPDGGLTAELGVRVVKIHVESMILLIESSQGNPLLQ